MVKIRSDVDKQRKKLLYMISSMFVSCTVSFGEIFILPAFILIACGDNNNCKLVSTTPLVLIKP